MVWKSRNDIGKNLLPIVYTIRIPNYNVQNTGTEETRKEELTKCLDELTEMWGEIRGWWLSGAALVSALTDTYPRTHSNLDIAIMADEEADEEAFTKMTENAKEHDFFLFRRTSSTKQPLLSINSPDKEEKLVLANPKEVIDNREKNRNYMLCRVDQHGTPIGRYGLRQRIRLYPHIIGENDALISTEDEREVSPGSLGYRHTEGRIIRTDHQFKRMIFGANLRELLRIHQEILPSLKSKRKEERRLKHDAEIQRISHYLSTHPNYLK